MARRSRRNHRRQKSRVPSVGVKPLVLSGAADEFRGKVLAEIAERHRLVEQHLNGFDFRSAPDCPFLWLKVPDPWNPGSYKTAAAAANVLLDEEDEFKPGRTAKVYHSIRIGFSNPLTRKETSDGLAKVRDLLLDECACYDSFE